MRVENDLIRALLLPFCAALVVCSGGHVWAGRGDFEKPGHRWSATQTKYEGKKGATTFSDTPAPTDLFQGTLNGCRGECKETITIKYVKNKTDIKFTPSVSLAYGLISFSVSTDITTERQTEEVDEAKYHSVQGKMRKLWLHQKREYYEYDVDLFLTKYQKCLNHGEYKILSQEKSPSAAGKGSKRVETQEVQSDWTDC